MKKIGRKEKVIKDLYGTYNFLFSPLFGYKLTKSEKDFKQREKKRVTLKRCRKLYSTEEAYEFTYYLDGKVKFLSYSFLPNTNYYIAIFNESIFKGFINLKDISRDIELSYYLIDEPTILETRELIDNYNILYDINIDPLFCINSIGDIELIDQDIKKYFKSFKRDEKLKQLFN